MERQLIYLKRSTSLVTSSGFLAALRPSVADLELAISCRKILHLGLRCGMVSPPDAVNSQAPPSANFTPPLSV